MSALCFLAAAIIFAVVAIDQGAPHPSFIPWGLTLVAAGLLLWAVGAPGWTWPRRP